MPPRLNIWRACRSLTIRPNPLGQCQPPRLSDAARGFADKAASRDLEADLTPLSALRASQPIEARPVDEGASDNAEILRQLELLSHGLDPFDPAIDGHKFHMTRTAWAQQMHLKDRYDPVLTQMTRLLMQHGKLAKAQRDMAMILNYLRTSPPPKINPTRPLLPGAPPPQHLPLDPVLYLRLAIDSVAPLLRVRSFAGMAGGGQALQVPVPLAVRQRRRTAFMWILDVVEKKPSRGSGRTMFAHRVAEELVAAVEGRSPVWDKRQLLHKMATSARANLNNPRLKRR